MHWTEIVAILACLVGGGLGGYALINPGWASRLVRLVPTEGKIEGKSEFRATYGGLFLLGHVFAVWAIATGQSGSEMAAGAIGAGWIGSGIGRFISCVADRTATGLNWFNVAFEFALGVALLAPLLLGSG